MGCDEVAKGIIESPSKTDEEQKREYRGKNIVAHPPLKKDDRSEPEKKMKSVVPAGWKGIFFNKFSEEKPAEEENKNNDSIERGEIGFEMMRKWGKIEIGPSGRECNEESLNKKEEILFDGQIFNFKGMKMGRKSPNPFFDRRIIPRGGENPNGEKEGP